MQKNRKNIPEKTQKESPFTQRQRGGIYYSSVLDEIPKLGVYYYAVDVGNGESAVRAGILAVKAIIPQHEHFAVGNYQCVFFTIVQKQSVVYRGNKHIGNL